MNDRPTRHKVRDYDQIAEPSSMRKAKIVRAFERSLDEAIIHGNGVFRTEVCIKTGGIVYAISERFLKENIL